MAENLVHGSRQDKHKFLFSYHGSEDFSYNFNNICKHRIFRRCCHKLHRWVFVWWSTCEFDFATVPNVSRGFPHPGVMFHKRKSRLVSALLLPLLWRRSVTLHVDGTDILNDVMISGAHIYILWRNYGPAWPVAVGSMQKGAQKGPIFKPYRARWGIGANFWDPTGARNLKLRHCAYLLLHRFIY